MNIFISWSGERSKFVAEALRDWIPRVIQSAKPWISSKDIFAGEDWNKEIEEKLGELKFGIICLTPENLQAPWIHFEAGSLSCKIKDKTLVCPYLVDLEPEDVAPPLSRFQLVKSSREGTLKIIESVNQAIGENRLDKNFLEETFNLWWPKLEDKLRSLPPAGNECTSRSERNEKDILIEILDIVRNFPRKDPNNVILVLDTEKSNDNVSNLSKYFQTKANDYWSTNLAHNLLEAAWQQHALNHCAASRNNESLKNSDEEDTKNNDK